MHDNVPGLPGVTQELRGIFRLSHNIDSERCIGQLPPEGNICVSKRVKMEIMNE